MKEGGGMRKRGVALVAALLVAVALIGAGCSSGSSSSSGGKAFFKMGTDSTIDSLNPMVAFQATAIWVHTNIYPYLLNYNNQAELIPSFATDWKSSEGG